MSAPNVVTLGCRLNTFESEVMRRHASAAGLDDVIIVNTCAVTAEAERQARQTIRRLRRENPSARIVVTGCAAQLKPNVFNDMPETDVVLGNAEKMNAAAWAQVAGQNEGVDPQPLVSDIMMVRETAAHMVDGFEGRTRAFVEVQQGCDHRCTFCIIPFARGPNRAVPADDVVQRVKTLVENGYDEAVLTGVDIFSYGMESHDGPQLGTLVRKILDGVPDLARLRLSSLDPAVMDETFFEVLANDPRMMPHLHLSAQSLDDMVLKRMKRRHSRDEALRFVDRARAARPDVVFGADLIAGFPTETDEMFDNTLRGVDEAGLTYLHVFPYSERPGTPAMRMPTVPKAERQSRARRLRDHGSKRLDVYLNGLINTTVDVLEEDGGRGFSAHYAPVQLLDPAGPGALHRALVTGVRDGRALARVA